jgi:hypothetical protein
MLKEMEDNLGQLKLKELESIQCAVNKIMERCDQIQQKINFLTSDEGLTKTMKIETSERERERDYFKTKEINLNNVVVPGTMPKTPVPKCKSKNGKRKRRAS